jgi:hypothetical protein
MHGFFFGSHIRTLEQHYKQHLQDYQDSKYSDMKAHAGTVHCFHLIGVLCVADKVLLQDLPLWLDGAHGPVVDWLNGKPEQLLLGPKVKHRLKALPEPRLLIR